MKALVIGYGRAGKRHVKLLEELGIEVNIHDPFVDTSSQFAFHNWEYLYEGLEKYKPDFSVICSPPDCHYQAIKTCLDFPWPILCEKPLCGFGELDLFRELPSNSPIMFAFNYRFHPELIALKNGEKEPTGKNDWFCISDQHRPSLPSWGLLLDHLGHTFDIMNWIDGRDIVIEKAGHYDKDELEYIVASGKIGYDHFTIFDRVYKKECNKIASVSCGLGFTDVPYSWEMYQDMYKYFLSHLGDKQFEPGLEAAIKVQYQLEQAHAIIAQASQ